MTTITRALSPRKCTDGTCPCQDGDSCHYEDLPASARRRASKAMPLPVGVYRLGEQTREALAWVERVGRGSGAEAQRGGFSLGALENLAAFGLIDKERRSWKLGPTSWTYISKDRSEQQIKNTEGEAR